MYKQSALFAYWMLMRKTQANYINPYVHKQVSFQRFTLSSVCKKLSKCIVKGSGSSRWWDFSHQNINGSNTWIAIKPSIGWRTSGHHIAFQRASNKCTYTSQENLSENQAFWKLPWKPLESLTYFLYSPCLLRNEFHCRATNPGIKISGDTSCYRNQLCLHYTDYDFLKKNVTL